MLMYPEFVKKFFQNHLAMSDNEKFIIYSAYCFGYAEAIEKNINSMPTALIKMPELPKTNNETGE